jgi:hypothetical protein
MKSRRKASSSNPVRPVREQRASARIVAPPSLVNVDIEPASASKLYPITLFFDDEAARDRFYQGLTETDPDAVERRRWDQIESTIRFLEDKPDLHSHDSLAHHAMRNARLRAEFARNPGLLSSEEVADMNASAAKNRAACANRFKSRGLVFAVEFRGEQRYPAFQFDPGTGAPKPIMKRVLEIAGDRLAGWPLAIWFVTPNGFLDELTPMAIMDERPDDLLSALASELAEFPG